MKKKHALLLLLPIIVAFSQSSAQDNSSRASLDIIRVSDFEITGTGSAPEWNNTSWENIPQRNNKHLDYYTNAKVLWSETGIYFLIECNDREITATMKADNLNLWEEDVVEVFLMPDEKYPLYFEYQLSPLNYELTLLIPNLEGKFLGWLPWKYEGDRKTRHKASIQTDDPEDADAVTGWTAEFFIPWKLMEPLTSAAPTSGAQWKANIYRLDHDEGLTRFSWNLTDKNFHEPHSFGTFIFK